MTWNVDAIEETKQAFNLWLASDYYFGYKSYLAWYSKTYDSYQEILKYKKTIRYLMLFRSHTLKELLKLQDYLDQSMSLRDEHNEDYMIREINENKEFLNTIEKYPLAEKQQRAVVCDEDHIQVIAGAGTWKTTTIIAKLLYLIKQKWIHGSNILMLAYTRNAANEMKSRLTKLWDRFNIDTSSIDIKTFHGFWLSIIWKFRRLIDNNSKSALVNKLVYDLVKYEDTFQLLTQFIFSYVQPVDDIKNFDSIEEYSKYIRSTKKLTTLKWERVKSLEELSIANYLYLNGIRYKYEIDYKHNTASHDHSQYQPDFYLPEYDIYLEHFGISKDEDGKLYSHFGEEYMDWYRWKLQLHSSKGTKLISSFSWENAHGCLLSNLKRKLYESSVKFKPIPSNELKIKIKEWIKYCKLTETFNTFLSQFKSIGYRSIDKIVVEHDSNYTRTKIFLWAFKRFYENYENSLAEKNLIDFDDMIRDGIQKVKDWDFISDYEYILIDEFQDISMWRYSLIKVLLDQNNDTKLFCVWDDWQSIFRFSWSYLDVFTNFEEYFPPYTEKIFLDKTYRFNQGIHEFSKTFIEENPAQLKKNLETLNDRDEWVIDLVYANNWSSDYINTILEDMVNDIEQRSIEEDVIEVYYITRYRAGPFEKLWWQVKNYCESHLNTKLSRAENTKLYKHFSQKYPEKEQKELANFIKTEFPLRISLWGKIFSIKFTTAHSAKWNEADYVIVDWLNHDYFWWFPALRSEDPILIILLDNTDIFKHAEERRLFYVALTRA